MVVILRMSFVERVVVLCACFAKSTIGGSASTFDVHVCLRLILPCSDVHFP